MATERGLKVVGTLGVLVLAKRRGLLPAVGPVMDRMVDLGMFVAPHLRERILVIVGELSAGGR